MSSVSDNAFLDQNAAFNGLKFFPPVCSFSFKVENSDFCVNEVMGFEPTGEGEHGIFEVTKSGSTTHDVLRRASKQFGVSQRDIGYAGLKDKVALTTQWISIPLSLKYAHVPLESQMGSSIRLRFLGHHRQKIRPGCHQGNVFSILLRDVVGNQEAVEFRLRCLANGFPNVFGEQRFGRGFSNLFHFARWKRGGKLKRQAKQLAVSAMRSMAFNQAVAERWRVSGLRKVQPGDWLMWQGSQSVYLSSGDTLDQLRLEKGDVDIAFPLIDENRVWCYGQEHGSWPSWTFVMNHWLEYVAHWRRTWVRPQAFNWSWEGSHLRLSFQLEKGAFATSLIASLGAVRDNHVV